MTEPFSHSALQYRYTRHGWIQFFVYFYIVLFQHLWFKQQWRPFTLFRWLSLVCFSSIHHVLVQKTLRSSTAFELRSAFCQKFDDSTIYLSLLESRYVFSRLTYAARNNGCRNELRTARRSVLSALLRALLSFFPNRPNSYFPAFCSLVCFGQAQVVVQFFFKPGGQSLTPVWKIYIYMYAVTVVLYFSVVSNTRLSSYSDIRKPMQFQFASGPWLCKEKDLSLFLTLDISLVDRYLDSVYLSL